jgi:molybdate transport system substrate-binding protein
VSHTSWQFAHGGAAKRRGKVAGAVSLRRAVVLACLPLVACGTPSTSGGPLPRTSGASLTVFAAASLSRVLPTEISAFEAANPGVTAQADYEGTQALLTKLEADGSLAGVFLSADSAHMQTARQRGIVSDARQLATNTLVIAVPPGNPAHIVGLADLARTGLKLSIADRSVPAGGYAEQAFAIAESNRDVPAGFAKQVLANLATRPTDVETVVANVASGVVDAGIVYATDARADTRVTAVPIPQRDQPVTAYFAAATAAAPDPPAAQAFVDFLLSASGQAILAAAGFSPPSPTVQPLDGGPATASPSP